MSIATARQKKADIRTEVRTFTPEEAFDIITNLKEQRPLRPGHVAWLAKQMVEGTFCLNGETIIMYQDQVLDGQHRLAACVESQVPLRTLVAYVDDPAMFATIDTGKVRNAGDAVAIVSKDRAMPTWLRSSAAYAAKIVMGTVDGLTRAKKINDVTNADVAKFVEQNPRIVDVCKEIRQTHNRNIGYTLSHMTALVALVEGAFPDVMETFVVPVATGAGLEANTGAYLFREKCIAVPKPADFRVDYDRIMVLWKAWNAHITKSEMRQLRYSSTEHPPILIDSIKELEKRGPRVRRA